MFVAFFLVLIYTEITVTLSNNDSTEKNTASLAAFRRFALARGGVFAVVFSKPNTCTLYPMSNIDLRVNYTVSSGKYVKRCILFCIACFSLSLLFSQEAEEDVITVNADKIEQQISDSVEQKRTITDEDIRKAGSKTVGDALKTLPDVTVSAATAGNAKA